MNPTWEDPIPDEDDDENLYERGFVHGRDAMIFLIDATWPMFEAQNSQEDETPFQLCLKCARTTLTNKIISSNKDLTAIVLFGTDKTKNSRNETDFKHIYIFQDLGEPGAERVLETEELMNMDGCSFADNFGHSTDFSLADALWVCSIMFSNCKQTLAHRRILLFTATDNPHAGSPQLQTQAKTKAKDLHESNIDIDLLHIQRAPNTFDPSLFFKDIALTAEDEDYKFPDGSEKFEDLLTRVRCKEHRKRPLGSLQFTIGNDVKAAFKMFKLVVPSTKPTPIKLAKENNAELTTVSNTYLSDTGEVLLPSDIKKYQEYGGWKIYFTDDEVKQIRHFGDPGLLLMGFKPRSCLKLHHHQKPSMFLYPDEKSIEGSTRLCFAFYIQCQKRGYVPICRLITRQNDPPRFVALLPQEEQVDEKGVQLVPPGFHVIFLPFMEDIRNMKVEAKRHETKPPLVEKAKEIIKKLQFAYRPDLFENPVLQKHWRNIEALALNRAAPEEIIDYTLPTKDLIEKRAGKLMDEFKALLCSSATTETNFNYAPPAKRQKFNDSEVPETLQHDVATGQLAKYKVNVLKEFCRRNAIRCGNKKADVIDAIANFYQQSC